MYKPYPEMSNAIRQTKRNALQLFDFDFKAVILSVIILVYKF